MCERSENYKNVKVKETYRHEEEVLKTCCITIKPFKTGQNGRIGLKNLEKISRDTSANPLPPPCVIW
jgi:hypothetical protein